MGIKAFLTIYTMSTSFLDEGYIATGIMLLLFSEISNLTMPIVGTQGP